MGPRRLADGRELADGDLAQAGLDPLVPRVPVEGLCRLRTAEQTEPVLRSHVDAPLPGPQGVGEERERCGPLLFRALRVPQHGTERLHGRDARALVRGCLGHAEEIGRRGRALHRPIISAASSRTSGDGLSRSLAITRTWSGVISDTR